MQISTAKVVLPNGDDIEGKGVKPDMACNPTGEEMREKRDVCLSAAVAQAREALHLAPVEQKLLVLDPTVSQP